MISQMFKKPPTAVTETAWIVYSMLSPNGLDYGEASCMCVCVCKTKEKAELTVEWYTSRDVESKHTYWYEAVGLF